MWLCQCDCGKIIRVYGCNLRSGNSQSCGCSALDNVIVHGGCGKNRDRLYKVWEDMKRRCYNQNDRSYKNYGGRGVRVCDDWLNDYSAFRAWAYAFGYDPNAEIRECTLDRIDNNRDYEPDNCRWISNKEQQNNTSRVRRIEYNDNTYTLLELSVMFGINRQTLYNRLFKLNWPIEKALTTPLMTRYSRNKKENDKHGTSA